jgi:tetratricopeptide (TPR) repeat protein
MGLVLALLGVLATAAHANGVATAKQLYDDGLTEYNLGHYDDALKSFENAYRIKHEPALLYNVGQCQRQLHQYEAAARSYRSFLRESTDAPATTRDQVQKLAGEMEHMAEEEAKRKAAENAEKLKEKPGETLPDQPPTPSSDDGQTPTVVEQPARRGARTLRLVGMGTGAAGLAFVGLGGLFAGLSKSAGDTAYQSPVYDPAADDRQVSYRTADIVCFAIGGAAIAAGVTLYVLGARR